MPTIKISKYATGSWPQNIGDTTLFYSGDSSRHAKDVEGIFLDNPPRLSPDCAGLVWRYYHDTDRYLLIHVQGSQVVNAALGRNYPFRAGYEVSRDDMNAIKFNIPAVLKAVPRIANMQGGRVPLETEVNEKTRWPKGEEMLKKNILNAFYNGQKLYIALDVNDRKYHEDDIFDAPELKMLLGAIHQMPEDVQRYMWFAFCVDSNYDYVLDDVPIVVYLKNRNIKITDGIKQTTWEEVTTKLVIGGAEPFSFKLPGKNEPLMPFGELQLAAIVATKKVNELNGEEWQVWMNTGHDLSEISTNGWNDFAHFVESMDETTRSEYIDSVRAASVRWNVTGLRKGLYEQMEYDKSQKSELRRKTEVLKDMLQGNDTYSFLYPKGLLTAEDLKAIDAKFLEELNLQTKEDIKKWCDIFKKNGCLNNKEVEKTFATLFEKHIFRSLYTTEEVLDYMKQYPFISGKYYQKPIDFKPPTKKQLTGINTELRKVVEKWVEDEAKNFSFDRIEDVIENLRNVRKLNEVEKNALEEISKERVVRLLTEGAQGGKFHDNSTLDACERLLDAIASLPYLSSTWQEKAEETFLPAVGDVIKNTEELSKDNLLDVSQWAGLGRMLKKYPGVFLFVKKRMDSLIDKSVIATELQKNVIRHFFIDEEETREKPAKRSDIPFKVVIPGGEEEADKVITVDGGEESSANEKAMKFRDEEEADKAYPLIETFIKILSKMKMEKNVKELRIRFQDLKSVKDKKIRMIKRYLAMAICFFAGLAVSALLLWKSSRSSGEPPKAPIISQPIEGADKHPMLQLADSLNTIGKEKFIKSFVYPGLKTDTLWLDSLSSFLPVSTTYAQKAGIGAATAYLYIKSEDGTEKKDSVIIKADNTLLQAANKKGCRIDKIVIGSVTVDIPNKKLADNDTIDMTNPYYYFRVIDHIGKSISNELSLTVAY